MIIVITAIMLSHVSVSAQHIQEVMQTYAGRSLKLFQIWFISDYWSQPREFPLTLIHRSSGREKLVINQIWTLDPGQRSDVCPLHVCAAGQMYDRINRCAACVKALRAACYLSVGLQLQRKMGWIQGWSNVFRVSTAYAGCRRGPRHL